MDQKYYTNFSSESKRRFNRRKIFSKILKYKQNYIINKLLDVKNPGGTIPLTSQKKIKRFPTSYSETENRLTKKFPNADPVLRQRKS